MKLHLVTPCSRPQNLPKIKESINFPCKWWIVFDAEEILKTEIEKSDDIELLCIKHKSSGNAQRNLALDNITDGYVYFLDDDNLMHSDFYKYTEDILQTAPETQCIFYSQQVRKDYIRNVSPTTIRVNHIDQAQFLLSREIIGDRRYQYKYEADGLFIEALYREKKDKGGFYFHNSPIITYYNKLV